MRSLTVAVREDRLLMAASMSGMMPISGVGRWPVRMMFAVVNELDSDCRSGEDEPMEVGSSPAQTSKLPNPNDS